MIDYTKSEILITKNTENEEYTIEVLEIDRNNKKGYRDGIKTDTFSSGLVEYKAILRKYERAGILRNLKINFKPVNPTTIEPIKQGPVLTV